MTATTTSTTTAMTPRAARRGSAVLALALATSVLAVTPDARATEPVTVRAVLHQRRAASDAGAVYVDIAVEGTRAPIRLVRRVAGSCVVGPAADPEAGVFVRVTCTTAVSPVTFEVARDGNELVVRRSMPPDSDEAAPAAVAAPDAPLPLVVIARSALPPRAAVRVRP